MSKTAKNFWAGAEARSFEINRTFLEIQQGPNPMTQEEINKLADKRPALWERFRR